MKLRLVPRLVVGAAALGLLGTLAAACGSDDPVAEPASNQAAGVTEVAEPSPTSEDGGGSAGSQAVDEGAGDVPDLQMIDMHTGTTLGLQSVVDGQTPLLFWFWAPH